LCVSCWLPVFQFDWTAFSNSPAFFWTVNLLGVDPDLKKFTEAEAGLPNGLSAHPLLRTIHTADTFGITQLAD
jgi:hypothetical protein